MVRKSKIFRETISLFVLKLEVKVNVESERSFVKESHKSRSLALLFSRGLIRFYVKSALTNSKSQKMSFLKVHRFYVKSILTNSNIFAISKSNFYDISAIFERRVNVGTF